MRPTFSNALLACGFLVLLEMFAFSEPVCGQVENHLILKKNGRIDKIHFFKGDPITFIRDNNRYFEESYIQGIGTDFIIVGGQTIPISRISYLVRTHTGFNFKAAGKGLMIAAPGYLVIGVINELFHHRYTGQKLSYLVPTPGNLIVAGSLLTAGAILPVFQIRKYHIGRKFSLRIVQSDPALIRQGLR
jgi:hypothetical protein